MKQSLVFKNYKYLQSNVGIEAGKIRKIFVIEGFIHFNKKKKKYRRVSILIKEGEGLRLWI